MRPSIEVVCHIFMKHDLFKGLWALLKSVRVNFVSIWVLLELFPFKIKVEMISFTVIVLKQKKKQKR